MGKGASGGQYREKKIHARKSGRKTKYNCKVVLEPIINFLILKRKLEWGRIGKPQSGPRIRTSIMNHKHFK